MPDVQLFHCPSCGAPLELRGHAKTIRCSYCNSSVAVPETLRGESDSQDEYGDIRLLMANNKKIAAVKRMREMTGMGLKEAKDAVEALERGESIRHKSSLGSSGAATPFESVEPSDLLALVREGKKIEAIKKLREATGLGLKDSKDVIDALERGDSLEAIQELLAGKRVHESSQPIHRAGRGFRLAGCVFFVVLFGIFWIAVLGVTAEDYGLFNQLVTRIMPAGFAEIDLTIEGEGIGPGQFDDPRTVAVDRDRNFYVGDFDTGRIQSFDPQGQFLWVINLGDTIIQSMDVSPGGLLYAASDGEVRRFQTSDGREIDPLPNPADEYVEDLAFGLDGRMAVIANGEDLLVYNADMQLEFTVRDAVSTVTEDSELDCEVAVDGLGFVYILGHFNNKVLKYSPEGRYLNQFGGETIEETPGKFRAPGDIAIDQGGRIFVSDIFGVQVFDSDGLFLDQFKYFQYAHGIDFDMQNNMFVVSPEPVMLRLILKE